MKAVLGNLPTFYLSLFVAPIGVLNTLEGIRRKFIWGCVEDRKKIHWVAWEKITAPKDMGGLSVGSIRALNLSLLTKWWWCLGTNPTASWARVIKGIHNLNIKPSNVISNKTIIGVWNNIAGIRHALSNI